MILEKLKEAIYLNKYVFVKDQNILQHIGCHRNTYNFGKIKRETWKKNWKCKHIKLSYWSLS